MNELAPQPVDAKLDGIIKLAIMAVGGQGGGVLTSWIEALARGQGYACQSTSVAGVAQRTGATIYYVEMAPVGAAMPVFSLAPAGGDVDVLIAAELMEAGRAIMRGFVTPDKTTLIASKHRTLAVSEKMTPGDGIAKPDEVLAAAEIAAERFVCFDMEKMAVANGSVISATLFGALAGSGRLPFDRAAFEDAIRQGGKGVEASLRAFAAAFERCNSPGSETEAVDKPKAETCCQSPPALHAEWQALLTRASGLPVEVQDLARSGLQKVVEFMDISYGQDYLAHIEKFAVKDRKEDDFALTQQAAKYVANAMAYDDVIRVADLKTRGERDQRILDEMGANGKVMHVTEFLHPRAEEIVGLLPARMGARWEANAKRMKWLDRWFGKGRRLRSDRIMPFLMLYILGGLKRYRRRTHRHAIEVLHLAEWRDKALDMVEQDYALAVEILKCRRLIKGYSDTHARGLSKFGRVMEAVNLLDGREDAAEWVARLREAALQDEKGDALDGAIRTIQSFS